MVATKYFIIGFIGATLLCLAVMSLSISNSPDKNCFLLEPDESEGVYKRSSTQISIGVLSLVVGFILAFFGFITSLSQP